MRRASWCACVRGAIWDVAVDIRRGSPTFGQHVGAVLSAENWQQLWVPGRLPARLLHAEPDTEVIYKVTGALRQGGRARGDLERSGHWPSWPVAADEVLLSDKDKVLPRLRDCAGCCSMRDLTAMDGRPRP